MRRTQDKVNTRTYEGSSECELLNVSHIRGLLVLDFPHPTTTLIDCVAEKYVDDQLMFDINPSQGMCRRLVCT